MAKLIFVIGATATGKSYFIRQNYEDKDVDIFNVYDYQQCSYDEAGFGETIPFGAQIKCLMRANQMLLDDIIEKLSHGRDVVVEQTFYKAKRRIAYIDEIRKKADVTIVVYVMHPSDPQWESNIKKRKLKGNFQSYKNNAKEFEFPNVVEGIGTIYEVVDGKIMLRMEPPRPEIMVKNKNLAKSISDAGWSRFTNYLDYKLKLEGKYLVKIDRWFASSKLCSSCYEKNIMLTLNDRVWVCNRCNTEHDRDVNASLNIRNEGLKVLKLIA